MGKKRTQKIEKTESGDRRYETLRKRVRAADCWTPGFRESTVVVSLHHDFDGSHRVAVWGDNDDCAIGMEKVFSNRAEAADCYYRISNSVNRNSLKSQGFDWA